eukprot:CAMPEP_0168693764 /NCGR_PEP_ID=MMETSP0503-20121227/33937_1 /TAXON_ID=89963 /ORGANISM="Heterocapsa rotundata, Strain SCCAP K-0483" /LENGTH=93 /DNA_ID=CAMNT_0008739369 /DNA_START=13 /DNA_END=291 /DNA_ORIENTATION=+
MRKLPIYGPKDGRPKGHPSSNTYRYRGRVLRSIEDLCEDRHADDRAVLLRHHDVLEAEGALHPDAAVRGVEDLLATAALHGARPRRRRRRRLE